MVQKGVCACGSEKTSERKERGEEKTSPKSGGGSDKCDGNTRKRTHKPEEMQVAGSENKDGY